MRNFLVMLLCGISMSMQYALAQPATFDATFGNSGRKLIDFDSSSNARLEYISSMQLSDGRILTLATMYDFLLPNTTLLIMQLPNGQPDNSFGLNGQLIPDYTLQFSSLLVQFDDKFILAGSSGDQFYVFRFLSNGQPDVSFGTNGKYFHTFANASSCIITNVVEDFFTANLEFIVSYYDASSVLSNSYLVLLDASGTTPAWFGNNGFQAIPTDRYTNVYGVPSFYFLAAGLSGTGFFIRQFDVNGNVDSNFDGDGTLYLTSAAMLPIVNRIQLAFDGLNRLVVMTHQQDWILNTEESKLYRFSLTGVPDATWDTDGVSTVDFLGGTVNRIGGIAIQSDNKIVVTGYANNASYDAFMVATRFNADGSLDASYGSSGRWLLSESSYGAILFPHLQADQSLYAVGMMKNLHALLRFNDAGVLTSSFGAAGIVITRNEEFFSDYTETIYEIAEQTDKKIIAAGITDSTLVVCRLLPNGTLDPSFATGGKFVLPFYSPVMHKILVQSDGKIVLVASKLVPNLTNVGLMQRQPCLVRLNSNGTLDNAYGTGGLLLLTVHPTYVSPDDALMDAQDKVLLCCNSSTYLFLIRVDNQGNLDTSFDGDGVCKIPAQAGFTYITSRDNSLAFQSDGKIVMAAWNSGNSTRDLSIIRLLNDGSFDTSFDSDGIQYLGNTSYQYNSPLAIRQNGKIVVASTKSNQLHVMSLNADGSIDASVGGASGLSTGLMITPYDIVLQDNDKWLLLCTGGILRLNNDGTTDLSFDGDGFMEISKRSQLAPGSVDVCVGTLLADERLLVGIRPSHDLEVAKIHLKNIPACSIPDYTKTYGDAAFTPSNTSTSAGLTTYTTNGTNATVNAGQVSITGAGASKLYAKQSFTDNYYTCCDTSDITIAKAALTITADNKARPEATSNPTLTYQATGFVYGETSAVISGSPSLSTTADLLSAVGDYPISISAGTLSASNYTFTFTDGTLSVSVNTALQHAQNNALVQTFPNPSNGKFEVVCPETITEICVTDVQGKEELHYQNTVSTNLSGMLVVKIITETNVYTTKLVVQ